MKKIIILILFCISFIFPSRTFADEGWVINRFSSDISIERSGSVLIKEVIEVDFKSLEKHGIYRDIPEVYHNDGTEHYTRITPVYMEMDGRSVQSKITRENGYIRIRLGDPNATISGKHLYVISYRDDGILQSYDTFDELYWNVTGNQWDVPIEKAMAILRLPEEGIISVACYEGEMGSREICMSQEDGKQSTFASTRPLDSYEGLTVAVGYKKGMVPILTVAKRTLADEVRDTFWNNIPALLLFFGITIGGIIFALGKWHVSGRDLWYGGKGILTTVQKARVKPHFAHETIVVEYAPPEGLRPAEMGVLVDERADTLDVTATIIDLAHRGYLHITEVEKKWLFGSTDYTLMRKKKNDTKLRSYESLLLDKLFESGDIVSVSSLKNKFYRDLVKVKAALYEDMTTNGYFDKNPESVRSGYVIWGVISIVGGFLMMAWIFPIFEESVILGIASGIIVLGIVLLIMSRFMPRRSAKGRELYRRILGYEEFISHVERYRQQFFEKKNMFNEVLAYAIIFGLTRKFATALADLGIKASQPSWYSSTRPFNAAVFASNVDTFSSSLSSAIASAPSSSGSGGGGSSGGGFGGGGGGSW